MAVPVQHIDFSPPSSTWCARQFRRGYAADRSRQVLGGDAITVPDQLIYSESLAGRFRFE